MKIGFHTLGCKVNQYETEAMKEQFLQKGHEIVGDEEFADVYVINTCTVTHLADRKSRQYIRKMKKVNPEAVVAVTGCYAQVSPEEASSIEGVNIVAGTNEKGNLVGYIEEYVETKLGSCHVKPYEQLREYQSTGIIKSMDSRTRAYIKIEEGCNRFCSYCIIPYARGPVRSRPLEEVVAEAKQLIESGFKEIILTGINTALYGTDIGLGGIEPLIKAIDQLPGNFRIRLSSVEPTVINKDYVQKLVKYSKLCPHLHLSIQSGSDEVLKAMNRKYSRQDYIDIVNTVQNIDSGFGITTDMIVGFPGESQEAFEDSCKMMEEVDYCKVHVFKYSKRKDTPAASFENQIDDQTKTARSKALSKLADESSQRFFHRCKNMERTTLFEEEIEEGVITGYTDNYIKVYVSGGEKDLNEFRKVKLIEPYKDGMKGEIVDE